MSDKKQCPLLRNGKVFADCMESQCAWWDSVNKACAITNISYWLLEIEDTIKRKV